MMDMLSERYMKLAGIVAESGKNYFRLDDKRSQSDLLRASKELAAIHDTVTKDNDFDLARFDRALELLQDVRKHREAGVSESHDRMVEADDAVEVTFKTKGDAGTNMARMLNHIADTAAGGHSFDIVVDPDDSEYTKKFGFDGDGADGIFDVEVDGKKIEKDDS